MLRVTRHAIGVCLKTRHDEGSLHSAILHVTCAAQVAAALCASYVGGSVNFAAVSVALGLPQGTTLAAAMAADVLVMAVRLRLPDCPASVDTKAAHALTWSLIDSAVVYFHHHSLASQ